MIGRYLAEIINPTLKGFEFSPLLYILPNQARRLQLKTCETMKAFSIFFLSLFLAGDTIAQACNKPNSLVSVTKRRSGRTEYVIFNLKKPTNSSAVVSSAKPPFFEDGSGKKLTIKGCRFKSVKFENIEWTCSISNSFSRYTYLVNQVKKTGQFEGLVEYVIGYRCNTRSVVSYSYDAGVYRKCVVRFTY